MGLRGVVGEERHRVGRGVVQPRHEERVAGDGDAARGEAPPHVRVVEEPREQARVDLARVSPAGAALQRAGVRVVGRGGAVPGDHHQAREASRQRHRPQDGLARRDPRADLRRGVERGRGLGLGGGPEPQRVAQQLGDVERPRRLDEGEGGHGGELEAPPGAHHAARQARGRVARPGIGGPALQPGDEQDGRARLGHVGGARMVAQGEAEEPREAQRPHARRRGLQRPAEDLRAHVDAEGRLRLGARGGPGRWGVDERGGQAPLRRPLGRVLEGGVRDLVGRGRQGGGVGGADLRPAVLDGLAVQAEQRLLPHQPHGEQILERAVVAARHLRLPEAVTGELRPAAQGHVEAVEAGGRRGAVEAERRPRPRDRRPRGGREPLDMGGEALQAVDLGRQVAPREGVPGGEGAPLGRGPERLAPVEMDRRPVPDPLGHQPRPVHPGRLGRQIRDRGERRGRRGRAGRRGAQRVRRGRRARRRRDGGGEVGLRDLARLDLGEAHGARRRDGDARRAGQPRGGHGQRLAGLAEIGVDGDGGGQRPERRHLPPGLHRGGEQLQRGARPGLAVAPHARTLQPPRSRSASALT